LTDFKQGSAIPKFAFSQRIENLTSMHWKVHRQKVSETFEKLIEISNSGDYYELENIYPEPVKRNPIVERLYNFTNSFGNSPVSFVDFTDTDSTPKPIYKINRFKSNVKQKLITEIKEEEQEKKKVDEGYGKIKTTTSKTGRKRNQVVSFYNKDNIKLEFAPEIVNTEDRTYYLNYPLRSLFEKEDDFFVIQNEMLSIIGTGSTEDEAEKNFFEEFDYVYQRFTSLKDEHLTQNNQFIKTILKQIVKKIE